MKERPAAVVALGMFDGVHIGHRALLARAREIARARGAMCVADTFSNHPAEVLGRTMRMLSGAAERARLLAGAGADEVRMREFTRALADQPPEAFVLAELDAWNVKDFVVGYNYSFGRGASGTPETLISLGARYGFGVEIVPPVLHGDEPVSSSRIRACIERGEVREAAAMLGDPPRPYRLAGTVVANKRIGRRIGFPTANILPEEARVLPKDGVYGALVTAAGGRYYAVTNVGTNPTVHGERRGIESHLLDFSGDLYGRELAVEFLYRIRDEIVFPDVDALKAQIAADEKALRERVLRKEI